MRAKKLRVGTARRSITPSAHVDLSGYAMREQPSLGIQDDIFVRAVVLDDGDLRAAVCSIEVLGLDREHVRTLRSSLADGGYAPGSLLFSCTHTHGAPAIQILRGCGVPSQEYVDTLLRTIAECVRQAGDTLLPCEASVGISTMDLAVNRRTPGVSGLTLKPNPQGPTDPEVAAMQFRGQDGQPLATIFNYACHAVIMGGDNRLVTGDWPGAAMRRLEEAGAGTTLFLQGCCGDINPRIRGTFEIRDQAGQMAADAVQKALGGASPVVDPHLSMACHPVDLPLLPNPGDAQLHARLEDIHSMPRDSWDWADKRDAVWCRDALERPELSRRERLSVEAGELSIGDVAICWLPGEAFAAYGRAVKHSRGHGRTLVAGYTNGNIGYIPTRAAYDEGGYEVEEAYRYYAYQMIGPESESLLLGALGTVPEEGLAG